MFDVENFVSFDGTVWPKKLSKRLLALLSLIPPEKAPVDSNTLSSRNIGMFHKPSCTCQVNTTTKSTMLSQFQEAVSCLEQRVQIQVKWSIGLTVLENNATANQHQYICLLFIIICFLTALFSKTKDQYLHLPLPLHALLQVRPLPVVVAKTIPETVQKASIHMVDLCIEHGPF